MYDNKISSNYKIVTLQGNRGAEGDLGRKKEGVTTDRRA